MKNLVKYVNPNVGTIGHLLSATAPVVEYPHGMAKISPLYRAGVRDVYTSDKIFGFSAGAVSLMPTISQPKYTYESLGAVLDHGLEVAAPHHYQVTLLDPEVMAEYTVGKHTGIFHFEYPENNHGKIAMCISEGSEIKVSNDSCRCFVKGDYHGVPAFCVYEFSERVTFETQAIELLESGDNRKKNDEATLYLFASTAKSILVKFAVSFIDEETALVSLEKEIDSFDFRSVKEAAFEAWNTKLNTIVVESDNEEQKKVFYTAMYRTLERMVCYSEHGRYLGYDGQIHNDCGHEFYCNDGIWDSFRCMHPLQLIIEPKVHEDILASYIRMYEQSGWMPKFPHRQGNIACMIGNHSASLFADSLVKGVSFDVEKAFEGVVKNALEGSVLPWYFGKSTKLDDFYKKEGFLPGLKEDEAETVPEVHPFEGRQAVAVTLETSYDDWCIAKLAERLGRNSEQELFLTRSENYRNLFNTATNFMAPKGEDGNWIENFDPKRSGGQGGRKYFAENNSWVYTYSVMHDIEALVSLFGGEQAFSQRLDQLFVEQYGTTKYDYLCQFPDATGLLGQFTMGNEPAFHIPYLYNYCKKPWKTQKIIHDITRLWFTNHPLGICGDEDGGAMSSWFVFTAMGFYPVCPGSAEYDIGSPLFDKCTITLASGKKFVINSHGAASGKKYIANISLNGNCQYHPKFEHKDLVQGGELNLTMQKTPSYQLEN